jgi:hypothetical protein
MFCVEASHQGYPPGPDAMLCLRAGCAGGLRKECGNSSLLFAGESKEGSDARVQATSTARTARAALETIRFERGDRRHVWGMIDDYFRSGRCCGCR